MTPCCLLPLWQQVPADNHTDRDAHFAKLEALATQSVSIQDLFKTEPNRLDKFVMREGPLRADFSKQAISENALEALQSLAAACHLEEWRAKLFAGDTVNTSENRAVLHMALRGVGGSETVQKEVAAMRKHMAAFAEKVRQEGKFKAVVHIGIGGSDLGPRLVADAFQATADMALDLRFAENVDGASINDALHGLDPKTSLVVVVSKSFTTQETRMNAEAARILLRSRLIATALWILIFRVIRFLISGIGSADAIPFGARLDSPFKSLLALTSLMRFSKGQRRWTCISAINLCRTTCLS